MKKLFLTLIIFNSLFIIAVAQQTNLDSLYTVWQDQNQSDSVRVEAYKDYIQFGFLTSDPDSAFALAEALYGYAKKHEYPKASVFGYYVQGTVNMFKSKYPIALNYYEQGLEILEKNRNKRITAAFIGSISQIYQFQGNYPKALGYIQKGLKIFEEIGDKQNMALCRYNLGGFLCIREINVWA